MRSAAVFYFFERHVIELEKQLRMGNQHRFFQSIKSAQLEETKKFESKCVCDEQWSLLRDEVRIRERWVRFFGPLLNIKSDILGPDIPKKLPQQPVASALGIEPTEEEIATAMKAIEKAKAVGPDDFPVENLMKLGLQQYRTILLEFHRLNTFIWRERKSHSSGKMWSLPFFTRKATRRNAGTPAAYRSCHTRVRYQET